MNILKTCLADNGTSRCPKLPAMLRALSFKIHPVYVSHSSSARKNSELCCRVCEVFVTCVIHKLRYRTLRLFMSLCSLILSAVSKEVTYFEQ